MICKLRWALFKKYVRYYLVIFLVNCLETENVMVRLVPVWGDNESSERLEADKSAVGS